MIRRPPGTATPAPTPDHTPQTQSLVPPPQGGADRYAMGVRDGIAAERALREYHHGTEALRAALALAYTALERCQPDAHDRIWYMDTVLPTVKRALLAAAPAPTPAPGVHESCDQ